MDEDLQKWYDKGNALKRGSHHYDYYDGQSMIVHAIVEQEKRDFSRSMKIFNYEMEKKSYLTKEKPLFLKDNL